jgi:hypothetical protein
MRLTTIGCIFALGYLSVCVEPAFAEVCDKVAGEDWDPASGIWGKIFRPAWLLLFVFLPTLLLAACFHCRAIWSSWILAILMIAIFVLGNVRSIDDDQILQAAINEGCHNYSLGVFEHFIWLIYALSFAFTGWRSNKMLR